MPANILLALAPIFFVMALGYGAGRRRMVDNRNVESLNTLAMTFALPAALFVAIASAPRGQLLGRRLSSQCWAPVPQKPQRQQCCWPPFRSGFF